MKKGFCGLGLLLFLIIFCSQEVLANVTLNVNVKNSTLANKIVYDVAGKPVTVTLPWKEKAVYGGGGEVAITVNNKIVGDLIIKVDILLAITTPSAIMFTSSSWLKYGYTGDFGAKVVEMKKNTETASGSLETVDKTDLDTLCLVKQLAKNTTITLFNFIADIKGPAHIIFTAILVDDASAVSPQVMGVDVQTVFFNYINPATIPTPSPIWLDLIKAD
ncbi:MAG: hypothetical protein V1844_03045 [Pseudomonadota bacterium]